MDHSDDARRQRAVTERLYLLGKTHVPRSPGVHDEHVDFQVCGSTGNVYSVILMRSSGKVISCTCPDSSVRHRKCKHCYFIQLKALADVPPAQAWDLAMGQITAPGVWAPIAATSSLEPGLSSISSVVSGVVQREWIGLDCAICLETMTDFDVVVYCQKTCGNSVHRGCFGMWTLKNKQTCVHCRGSMT